MLASSPQVEQLGLAIRFDCSDIGGDKGMVVGRRMREELSQKLSRESKSDPGAKDDRKFRSPV